MMVPGEGVEPSWTEIRGIIYQPPIPRVLNHSTPLPSPSLRGAQVFYV
jgi:hypothetical protein